MLYEKYYDHTQHIQLNQEGRLMSSVFAEQTIVFINDYRTLLRKTLPQADRMIRLKELGLRSATIYSEEADLYTISKRILKDIELNGQIPEQGYYSYSGLQKFYALMKDFLAHYTIINDKVVNRIQHTSSLLLEIIQMISAPGLQQPDELQNKLLTCNSSIVANGSSEQKQLYLSCLERLAGINRAVFTPVLEDFTEQLEEEQAA